MTNAYALSIELYIEKSIFSENKQRKNIGNVEEFWNQNKIKLKKINLLLKMHTINTGKNEQTPL